MSLRPFEQLQAVCQYSIRPCPHSYEVRVAAVKIGNPADMDSPIGMNDTLRTYAYFSHGKVFYMDYGTLVTVLADVLPTYY